MQALVHERKKLLVHETSAQFLSFPNGKEKVIPRSPVHDAYRPPRGKKKVLVHETFM